LRLYTASSEESLRDRKLLVEWSRGGSLSQAQYERLEQETVSLLRTTNIFLRLILLLFTLISVSAGVLLFFTLFSAPLSEETTGIFLLIFAVICYVAAEVAASRGHLYRHGIEEGLAVCAAALLCLGVQATIAHHGTFFTARDRLSLVPATGVMISLWIWRRFGLWYAFLVAMIFVHFLPGYWIPSQAAQHVIVAVFYTGGLAVIGVLRSRHHFDCADDAYSPIEALLWLGLYLDLNLRLLSVLRLSQWDIVSPWQSIGASAAVTFPGVFYWTTWVLIWCLPPLLLARGIRRKDRLVMAAGTLAAILTLITNKPYLGWQQHSWDPMLLGIGLTGAALLLRRWLVRGPGGIRYGFTAARLSAKDQHWADAGATLAGLVSGQAIAPKPQETSPDFHFGGGSSGGGGAQGKF
jgi:hypothetical protein